MTQNDLDLEMTFKILENEDIILKTDIFFLYSKLKFADR